MKQIFILLCLVFLSGCSPKKQSSGPLAQFDSFEISVFAEGNESKNLQLSVTEALGKVGKVGENEKGASSENPILLFTFVKDNENISGSIQVICDAKVVKNGFNTACTVWKENFNEGSVLPVLHDGKVAFEKDESVNEIHTLEGMLDYLISKFFKEFQKDNPNGKTLNFYFS